MISLLLAVAALSASYDCTLEVPKALSEQDGAVLLNPINFPGVSEGNWKFQTNVVQDKKGIFAHILWPSDPIQIAGKYPAMPTANGSIAFMTFSSGPCMFTETGCMSLINLVDRGDGSAKMIIMPAALASDETKDSREPFVVLIKGTCLRTGKLQ